MISLHHTISLCYIVNLLVYMISLYISLYPYPVGGCQNMISLYCTISLYYIVSLLVYMISLYISLYSYPVGGASEYD